MILTLVIGAVAVLESQTTRAGDAPVVVELFTSQGCSSCPSADALLRRIAADPKLRGKVIPLAYHVDYWDHLGWRDPFSSHEWSQRQGDYVRAMKLASAYTPQMVVNGAREMVGSNSFAVYKAIEEESRRKHDGQVNVRIDGGQAIVRAQAAQPGVELVIVTFENGAADTKVARGENSGRTMVNDAIVRSLARVKTQPGRAIEQRVALGNANGVAAFLQQEGTRRIVASAAATNLSR
ncbi:MAG: DUF1223 domain-containing protein [Thermoanaerobaculia bacterium]